MNAPILITTLAVALLTGLPISRTRTGSNAAEPGPRITFIDSMVHDFGSIAYASAGRCSFRFTNTGDTPLIIEAFQSSCGCLVPYYDREPVMPGDTGSVSLRYDTHRVGPINKSATLKSNAVDQPVVVLRIKGTVLTDTTSQTVPPAR